MQLLFKRIASPVGELRLVAGDLGLVAILWKSDTPERVPLGGEVQADDHPLLIQTETQLRQYFAGERTAFDLPLDPRGTPFQLRVWSELRRIPFGQTRSYGELARQLGDPNLSRAVGAANGRNPLSIVVPCHRVVGASGRLTGFAGGLPAKDHLLRLEGVQQPLFA